jgi:hypothetical protein
LLECNLLERVTTVAETLWLLLEEPIVASGAGCYCV